MPRNTENVEAYVWSTSDASRQQLLVVHMVRCVVEKFGGTMEADPETHSISVDVPEEVATECAQEVMETVDLIYRMPWKTEGLS